MNYFESKKLREERQPIVNEIHELAKLINAEKRSMSAEEREKFDRLETAEKDLSAKIETAERLERSAELFKPEQTEQRSFRKDIVSGGSNKIDYKTKDNALKAWALTQVGVTPDSVFGEAAQRSGLNLSKLSLDFDLDQYPTYQRAQTTVYTEGGYTIDKGVVMGFEQALKHHGGVRSAATVVRTESGSPYSYATNDDTGNSASIVGQNTTISNTSMTFGEVVFGSYKYASAVYKVSVEVLQDSKTDLGSMIGEALGLRISRGTENHYTVGSGSSQPTGIVTSATLGHTLASSNSAITYADLVTHYHKCDYAYRTMPGCAWMFNDSTLAHFKTLLDGENRPLWVPSLSVGEPDRLLGKPYYINNFMASLGADDVYPVIFGDLKKFQIRDVGGVTIKVLNERFAEDAAIAFIAYFRTDSNCLQPKAIYKLKTKTAA